MRKLVYASLLIGLLLTAGCGQPVTYPANTVPRAIEEICKKEYDIEVTARVVGKTVGALVLVDDLIGADKQVKKDSQERIFRVMSVIARVVLSSDLPVDFCTVIVRDQARRSEFSIIRYLDDMKRMEAYMIGIDEMMQRLVIGQERPLQANEEDTFVLKDISLGEFLADQMAQRIRFSFVKDIKKDSEAPLVATEGIYEADGRTKNFKISILSFKTENSKQTILNALKTIGLVLGGYKFSDLDVIEVRDYINRQKLVIDRNTFKNYLDRKLTDEQLLKKCLTEYRSIQDTFRFFGNSSTIPDILDDNS